MPNAPEGLQVTFDGEIQSSFFDKFGNTQGVFLVLHDGHCLCSYKDWKTLFEYVESIRQANDVDKVPVMVFTKDVDYSGVSSVELDLELDFVTDRPKQGVIMFVGISVERRLTVNVGNQVSLLFKNGKTANGTLTNYQIHGQYGEISTDDETIYFKASEIRHIDTIV